jgi:hypothetical protein
MARSDVYVIHYTAVIHGTAYYRIPEGDKLKHFVDGSSEIEWNMSTIERIEAHDEEWVDTVGDDDEDETHTVEVDLDGEIPF